MKRAIVDIVANDAGQILQALEDNGLSVVRTLDSPEWPDSTLRFLIEGDVLPDECAEKLYFVLPTMTLETVGRQELRKIVNISLLDEYKSPDRAYAA